MQKFCQIIVAVVMVAGFLLAIHGCYETKPEKKADGPLAMIVTVIATFLFWATLYGAETFTGLFE